MNGFIAFGLNFFLLFLSNIDVFPIFLHQVLFPCTENISNEQVVTVEKFISIKGNNDDKIESLQNMFAVDLTGQEGIAELKQVLNSVNHTSKDCCIVSML